MAKGKMRVTQRGNILLVTTKFCGRKTEQTIQFGTPAEAKAALRKVAHMDYGPIVASTGIQALKVSQIYTSTLPKFIPEGQAGS